MPCTLFTFYAYALSQGALKHPMILYVEVTNEHGLHKQHTAAWLYKV